MEVLWDQLVSHGTGHTYAGYDLTYPLLFGVGNVAAAFPAYFVLGFLYFLLDTLDLPFFRNRRLQPAPKFTPRSPGACVKAMLHAALAQVLVVAPLLTVVYAPLLQWRGCPYAGLPTWGEGISHLMVCALVNDFVFYWFHRTAHHPLLYGRFHKQHHEFKAPFGWASQYASYPELLIVDLVPFLLGPLVVGTHLFTAYCWTFIRVGYSVEVHSGYDLWVWRLIPFYGGAPMHDWHHKTGKDNYSDCFVVWDKVFGTWSEPPPLQGDHKGA